MRIAVFDRSGPACTSDGAYSWLQLCALLLASKEDGETDISFITHKTTLGVLPPAVADEEVTLISVPPHAHPELFWRAARKLLSYSGIKLEPRMRAWRRWARSHAIDVIVSPNLPKWWQPCDTAVCTWIPDFQHEKYPQFFSSQEQVTAVRETYRSYGEKSDLVLVSSAAARDEFSVYLPDWQDKVRVFSFPSMMAFCNATSFGEEVDLASCGVGEEFFLVANQFWAHKNHQQIIDAMGIVKLRGKKPPQVVMIGNPVDHRDMGGSYLSSLLMKVAELGLHEEVRILGFVPNHLKNALFRRCKALIQPSMSEGWNISVQDAKAIGRPTIVSDIAVHREQVPDAFAFVRIGDAEAMADVLLDAASCCDPGPNLLREAECMSSARDDAKKAGQRLVTICRETLLCRRMDSGQ